MIDRRNSGSAKNRGALKAESSHAMEHFTHDEIFRVMVRDSPLPVSIQDNSWRFVFVNDAYCEYTGYSAQELIGQDPSSLLFPPEDSAALVEKRRQVADQVNPLLPEYDSVRELVRKDGERVRFHVDMSSSRTRKGEQLWCGVIFDLTHLESTRAELVDAREQSAQMRFRFDSFAALSNEAMIVAHIEQDKVLHVNDVAWDVLGIATEKLADLSVASLWQHIAVGDKPSLVEALRRGASQRGNEVSVMIAHPNGNRRALRIRTFRSARPDSETYILAEDVTEQLRLEQQRLEQALVQRDALVREVHHRIKNNLQGVIGVLQSARAEGASARTAINEAIHKINAIAEVNGMLTSGNSRISVNELISRLSQYLANAFNATVKTSFTSTAADMSDPYVDNDAVPVALVMNEIITNSIKHHQSDAPIRVEVSRNSQALTVTVRNIGTIPDRHLFASIEPGTHGLGLVKDLLPDQSANFYLEQEGPQVVARFILADSLLTADTAPAN